MLVNVYQMSSHACISHKIHACMLETFSEAECFLALGSEWGGHCFKFIRLLGLGPFSWESYKDPVPSERFQ